MTPFEQAQEQVKNENLRRPNVSDWKKNFDYFGYQLLTHKFNLSLMAKGMTFKGISFRQIKKYYGLTGKSAKDCLPQFLEVIEKYKYQQELNPQ